MPAEAVASDDQRIHDKRARRRAWAAMHAVADGLTGQGLDILGQEWEEAFRLKATNAWGALCEATIGPGQLFRWEYRSADGCWTDPVQIAAMAMILLGADNATEACALVPIMAGAAPQRGNTATRPAPPSELAACVLRAILRGPGEARETPAGPLSARGSRQRRATGTRLCSRYCR